MARAEAKRIAEERRQAAILEREERIAAEAEAAQKKAEALARMPPWRRIVAEVEDQTGYTLDEILGESRIRPLVAARYLVFYRLAAETDLSYSNIGHRLKRDHTTVLHGGRKHATDNNLPWPPPGRPTNGR